MGWDTGLEATRLELQWIPGQGSFSFWSSYGARNMGTQRRLISYISTSNTILPSLLDGNGQSLLVPCHTILK